MEEEVELLLRVKHDEGIQGSKTFLINIVKIHMNSQRLNQHHLHEYLPGFRGIYYDF